MTQKIIAKILLIEDDDAIREMYAIKFKQSNIPLHVAADGIKALAVARALKPDILLLDIKMPRLAGDEILEALLKEDWSKKMRIIVLTNINRREAPEILKSDRINRFAVKAHHTPTEVVTLVKEQLREISYDE